MPLFSLPDESRFLSAAERAYIRDGQAADTSAGEPAIDWWRLFTYRHTWAYLITKFLTDPISWFWLIWLPDFFNKTRGYDIKNSWRDLVIIYTISLALSVTGGWFSGFLLARGWSATAARKTGLLVFALCVTPVVLAIHSSVWVAVLLIGLALAAHHAWATTFYAIVSDIFPKATVAAIAGLGGMAGSVGGILFPTFCGWMLDRYKDRPGGETAGYAILFAICSTAYLVAFVINHLLAPRFEPIERVPRIRAA